MKAKTVIIFNGSMSWLPVNQIAAINIPTAVWLILIFNIAIQSSSLAGIYVLLRVSLFSLPGTGRTNEKFSVVFSHTLLSGSISAVYSQRDRQTHYLLPNNCHNR